MIMEFLIYIPLLFILWLFFLFVKKKVNEERKYNALLFVFKSHPIKVPKLKFGSSYEWDTFQVLFSSKEDYEYSEKNKLFEKFNEEIAKFYDSDFDPEMAIYYSYPNMKIDWSKITRL